METEKETLNEFSEDISISRGVEPDQPKVQLDRIRNYLLYDECGREIRFGEVYKDQKTIVIFVRHFLDYTCKEYVEDLAKIPADYFKEAGVKLVVIGPAPYKFIKEFKHLTKLDYNLYTDPDRALYKAFGCIEKIDHGNPKKSKHVKSGMLMGVLSSTWRAMRSDREFQGDIKQQGGAFIIGPGDEIHYGHRDNTSTDHKAINDLLSLAGVQQVSFQKDPRIFIL